MKYDKEQQDRIAEYAIAGIPINTEHKRFINGEYKLCELDPFYQMGLPELDNVPSVVIGSEKTIEDIIITLEDIQKMLKEI